MLMASKRLSDIPFSFYYSQLSFGQPSSAMAASSSTLDWSVLLSSVLWEPLAVWTLVSQQPRLYLASQRGVTQYDSLWVRVSVKFTISVCYTVSRRFSSHRSQMVDFILRNNRKSKAQQRQLIYIGHMFDLNKFGLRLWFIRMDQWDPMRSSTLV